MGCYYIGWGVSTRFWVLEYVMGVLVYGMGCWLTVWGVSIQDGVLLYRIGC